MTKHTPEAIREMAASLIEYARSGQVRAHAAVMLSELADERDADGMRNEPLLGKYGDVLRPFVAMMDRELHANAGKGDRPGWLTMDRKTALLEIFYHLGKLQKAVRDDNQDGIREYAADVANMTMMLVDVCGALETTATAASFQDAVGKWMDQCFVPSLYSNMVERGDRLLEEVLELLQATGYDRNRVSTLVDYVFGRPVGDPHQEVGGVMITLAGFCYIAGLDMHAEGQKELERITRPEVMAKIRAKQAAKNALHFDTPLPGNAARQENKP